MNRKADKPCNDCSRDQQISLGIVEKEKLDRLN